MVLVIHDFFLETKKYWANDHFLIGWEGYCSAYEIKA